MMIKNWCKKAGISVTTDQMLEFDRVLEVIDRKTLHNRKPQILKMVEFDVEFPWVDKLLDSAANFKTDSSSLKAHISRYGNRVGSLLFDKKCSSCGVTKDMYLKTHTEDDWDALNKKRTRSLEYYIDKYGKEEGTRKLERYLTKWRSSIKQKGGWSNGLTLDELVTKHGETEGLSRWSSKRQAQSYRFSVDWYIEKYGEEEGISKWNSKKIEYRQYLKKASKCSSISFSKVSQKLFKSVLKSIHDKELVFFAQHNGEVRLDLTEDCTWGHWIYVDFLYKDKVIEFDGTYWHSKPDIVERDRNKDTFLKDQGYSVLRVKEEDYKNNPIKELNNCLNFLKIKS